MNLEFNQVLPVPNPLIKKGPIVRFHQLIAGCQVLVDPAGDVSKTVGCQPAVLFEPAIYGCGITVPEVLDYHEQQADSPTTLPVKQMRRDGPGQGWDSVNKT